MKQEYRAVQDELKNLRTESRTLRLGQTEMQGELNSKSDRMAGLQLENAKLQQKCDVSVFIFKSMFKNDVLISYSDGCLYVCILVIVTTLFYVLDAL